MSLESLRRLLAEATPGPWESVLDDECEAYIREIMVRPDPMEDGGLTDADAALVCELRNHADVLLDIAEAAQRFYRHNEHLIEVSPVDRVEARHKAYEDLAAALARLGGNA